MTTPIDDFAKSNSNWRDSLRANNRKTFLVIAVFFLLYLCIGLLIDTYVIAGREPTASISDILNQIVHLQVFPLASVIMLMVAAISLFVTFAMSDQLMLLGTDYREITPTTAQNPQETQLYNIIEEMKIAAGLQFMPRVYIIEANYMNAFASGYSEKSAMVAITRGLMEKLNRSETAAVMAHEISHVRHMDIKLTLMASVLANLTLMIMDIFFFNVIFSGSRDDNRSRNALVPIIILIRYLLPILNILLLLYLSRTREFMADAGCVELMRDNQPLASALLKISNDHEDNKDEYAQSYQQTPHENVRREAYIYDPVQAGIEPQHSIADAFSTHPSLRARLEAIGFKQKDNS